MLKRRIPYLFLLTALVAIPLYFLRDKMDSEEIRKKRYWIGKVTNKKQYPVVFGGDSRVFRGISPDHFEAEFDGYEAYNYAFWSNGYCHAYLEGLENKLDTASDVKVIVLGISPHSLTPNAARCAHYLWETGKKKEEVLQNLYFSRVEEFFVPYDLPELAGKLSGKSKPDNYRITYHTNGWVESSWIVPDTGYSARFYEDIFTENKVSDEVIGELLRFTARWTGMGIHVVGFRPPTAWSIWKLEQEKSGFNETAFVDRFKAAGGIWIPFSLRDYQTFDGNHLDRQSAMRLSADLAIRIRQQIPDLP